MVATRTLRPTTDISAADLKSLQCPSLPLARSPNAVVCPPTMSRGDAMAQHGAKSWPLFRSLAAWRPADLPGDLIAGLTLAAIAIPEQMATARLRAAAAPTRILCLSA